MSKEQLLYESDVITPEIVESQVNSRNSQNNHLTETDTGDIAPFEPKVAFGKPVPSMTLPAMIGYVQPLTAPQGFIFGLTKRDKTAIPGSTMPEDPENPESLPSPDDLIITRRSITTSVREVVIGTTNEVEQDIMSMFGDDFAPLAGREHGSSHKPQETETDKIARYFSEYGEWLLNAKVNEDFMTWLDDVATNKGAAVIDTYNDMHKIFGAIGELREALSKQTGKNGQPFIIVTPRIANFIASTVGFVANNGATWFNNQRKEQDASINPYVGRYGDIEVFTWLSPNGHPSTPGGTTETTGAIYMGYLGISGPGTASVYYAPYKKYIVKGGSSAYTGQSNVFYRIRDAFALNPQDTLDHSQTDTNIPDAANNAKFVVKADITFNETVLA